jgi:3-hydroxymyristoyl/3-hydroxydecanoyl-(acyl carrier protein) dehydratase
MLRDEIKRWMTDFSTNGNGHFSARFAFPSSFGGFLGHFPKNPILPGICTIQAALVMLETSRNRRPTLQQILHTKFYSVVQPDAPLQFQCQTSAAPDGTTVLKASVDCLGNKIARIQLKASFPDPLPAPSANTHA